MATKTTKKANKEIFNEIISVFKDLDKRYPGQGLARHIADATADYKNLWILGNKELLFALNKYMQELELNIVDEKEVDKIISDAKNLDTILNKEDPDAEEGFFNVDEQEWIK